ncbi:DNA/RNA non-specific endonuclease [Gemmatimonas phototrophica]|uniref:DNA/RNA non-specific endonuclease n=1 Tax=Gemmatimonas phototrophica TaxID=1379270 RepID=UPI001314DB13|nr:DNA/RNA non-specific endonuclease [Gemmatimonas phototrophica]
MIHTRYTSAALAAAAVLLSACGADRVTSTAGDIASPRYFTTNPAPSVRFSEIHYDNNGTDANERIEISMPVGQDLTGWQLVLYNGANGQSYSTGALAPLSRSACVGGEREVVVALYPVNGIQNGSPDGMALVNGAGSVVEFLSYEGVFQATNGPAVGITSTDIGASETGGASGTSDGSVARGTGNTWVTSNTTNTFGACNDGTTNGGGPTVGAIASVTVAPTTATVQIGATKPLTAIAQDAEKNTVTTATFTWASSDETVATVSAAGVVTAVAPGSATITASSGAFNGTAVITVPEPATLPAVRFTELHYDNSGEDYGEAIEIEGPANTDLTGWQVVLYNGNGGRQYDIRTLSGSFANECSGRGVKVLEYPTGLLQNGPDGMALVNAAGAVVEFLSYEGVFAATDGPAAGMTSRNIGVSQSGAAVTSSLQRSLSDVWSSSLDSFGVCNGRGTRVPRTTLSFGFRTPFDPALPVGFEDLLTVTQRLDGQVVTYDVPMVSETPATATVLPNNVIRGVGVGTARFRATTANGFTLTFELPIREATASTTAVYADHTEFGVPVDGSPADDYVVRRDQMAFSYSRTRNTPNWVSYNLEDTHVGGSGRCECFTFDSALPASFTRYSTFDYVGSGYSRGHLVKSQDRTTGVLDNATTFYFTNIIPQTEANNEGPWLQLENYLTNKADVQNKEVFIITGVAGSRGTLNDRGVVTIPENLWKVAIVLPRNRGLADVNAGLVPDEIIAVVMPNADAMPSPDWTTYRTTVDSVEALSGYDLLALLNDQIEIAVESNTKAPVARVNGPFEILAGESVTLSAAASTDADGDALTYRWTTGDGRTVNGVSPTVQYSSPGTFTATVTVTDIRTLFSQASTTVRVLSSAEGLEKAAAQVTQLGTAGRLNRGQANSLAVKIRNAGASISRTNPQASAGQLGALVNELHALVQSRRLSAADAAPALLTLERVIASLPYGVL